MTSRSAIDRAPQPDLSKDELQSLFLIEARGATRSRYSAGGSRREQPRRGYCAAVRFSVASLLRVSPVPLPVARTSRITRVEFDRSQRDRKLEIPRHHADLQAGFIESSHRCIAARSPARIRSNETPSGSGNVLSRNFSAASRSDLAVFRESNR